MVESVFVFLSYNFNFVLIEFDLLGEVFKFNRLCFAGYKEIINEVFFSLVVVEFFLFVVVENTGIVNIEKVICLVILLYLRQLKIVKLVFMLLKIIRH